MKNKALKVMRNGLLTAACCLVLTGCGDRGREMLLHTDTQMSQNQIRVNRSQFSTALDAAKATPEQVARVAQDYNDNGVSQMIVRVTYDRAGDDQRAEVALKQVSRISKMLQAEGVKNPRVVIMPVDEAYGQALVTYNVLEALPPEGCGFMPGMDGASIKGDTDSYKLGCDTRLMMSKQIARPKDLLGNDTSEGFDAKREGTLVDTYVRQGQPMPSLGNME